MTARDKARAAKLRRIPEAAFGLEAARRGFVKMNENTLPFPTKLARGFEAQLRERAMHMIEHPEHAVNDLATVRAMMTTADWMKTFLEIHETELASRKAAAK